MLEFSEHILILARILKIWSSSSPSQATSQHSHVVIRVMAHASPHFEEKNWLETSFQFQLDRSRGRE